MRHLFDQDPNNDRLAVYFDVFSMNVTLSSVLMFVELARTKTIFFRPFDVSTVPNPYGSEFTLSPSICMTKFLGNHDCAASRLLKPLAEMLVWVQCSVLAEAPVAKRSKAIVGIKFNFN